MPDTMAAIPSSLQAQVEALLYDAARFIDDDRWEVWVDLFTADGVYKIVSRENHQAGLPLGIVYCDSRDMIGDRILSLRKANIYNLHYDRHFVTNVRIVESTGGVHTVNSNYAVYQSTPAGESSLFSIGKYADQVVIEDGAARFKERIVIVDTGAVKNLISSPL